MTAPTPDIAAPAHSLVERLRRFADMTTHDNDTSTISEAADEIERLCASMTVLKEQRVTILAEMYRMDYKRTAVLCDETLDRSGALLGYVRVAALRPRS
jgi:hypothetical protein